MRPNEPAPPPIVRAELNPFRAPEELATPRRRIMGILPAMLIGMAIVAAVAFAGGFAAGRAGQSFKHRPTSIEEMDFKDVAALDRQLPDCNWTGQQLLRLMQQGTLGNWRDLEPEEKIWASRLIAATRHPNRTRKLQVARARSYILTLDGFIGRTTADEEKKIAAEVAELDKVMAWAEANPALLKQP